MPKLKLMSKLLLGFVLIFYLSGTVHSQATITPQTLNISGGSINLGYHQLEWSVGEATVIETFTQPGVNGFMLTNGVLQPLTDKPFIQSIASNWTNEEIRIFPNPTRGNFEVNVLSKQQGLLTIQLVDGIGSIMKTTEYFYYGFGKIERFNLTNASSQNFYLRITLSPFPGFTKKVGSYKILKIN